MLGGIQPGGLRSYLAEALADGPSNDGLIQRFQLLVAAHVAYQWHRAGTKMGTVRNVGDSMNLGNSCKYLEVKT
jgi:hypothetical protein